MRHQHLLVLGLGAAMLVGGCATEQGAPPAATRAVNTFSLVQGQTEVGSVGTYVTREADTLLDVARAYDLGYTQLMAANPGIDPWLPGAGRRVTLPSRYLLPEGPRRGIVVNLVQQRLFYFSPDGRTVETSPVGVAVQGRSTPAGTTRVIAKQAHPTWHPPPSIREERPDLPVMIGPGPDNPLGDYAMRLGWGDYLIHGTNNPDGVGRNSSHGCLRLYPEDIARLFSEVPVGTPVRVVTDEVQAAAIDGELYLAVYPSKDQAEELDTNRKMTPAIPPELKKRLAAAAGPGRVRRIDWEKVAQAARERTGIPVRVSASAS